MKTSEQAYEEYQRLRVVEDKLRRDNKGLNLINSQKSSPTFSIHLFKKVEGNLLTMKSEILVNSNLPFMNWNFQNVSIDEFFEKFEEYVKLPIFKRFIKLNRCQENKLSGWGLTNFREDIISIKDIDISFGEECLKQVSEGDIVLFKNRIKTILSKQHLYTESESKDFTRYFILCEKAQDLRRQVKSSNNYCYDRNNDKSIKMTLSDEEYNNKLKLIEDELKALNKKYEFLSIPRLDYKENEGYDEDNEECDY